MDPRIVASRVVNQGQQVNIQATNICVNCYPLVRPSISIWFGLSLCESCLVPRRKLVDYRGLEGAEAVGMPVIDKRDYKDTWGEDVAEVI